MIVTDALELEDSAGRSTGRWRAVQYSDEAPDKGCDPLCECGGPSHTHPTTAGHETPIAALACPEVRRRLDTKGGTSC